MILAIELTQEEEAALTAEASTRGLDLPEFAKLRLLEAVPPTKTWGAAVLEKWKQSGIIGAFGDMSKDSSEVARELRGRLEVELFPSAGTGESPADAA